MTIPDIQSIRTHIINELLNDSAVEIEDDEDLLLSGILDSLTVMRLVAWLESQMSITIPAGDVVLEHFGSLRQIRQYLEHKVA